MEREVLRLIAANRSPISFVAGATVLHQSEQSVRSSQDVDVFHDTSEALKESMQLDLEALRQSGYHLEVYVKSETFARASVSRNGNTTKIEWVADSAFRFFPVEADPELGYRLNFWDAATNKILAGSGRAKVRDYIDMIFLHRQHLPLGALIWAAAGKDDGLSPGFIVEELSRVHRYPKMAYDELRLTQTIDTTELKMTWVSALREARELFDQVLLDAPYGCFFLNAKGQPVCPTPETLPQLKPHFGSVRGCWPQIVDES
jgi:hypothetical protein